jgi:hypothetical protein
MVSRIGGDSRTSAIKSPPAPHYWICPIRQLMGVAHYVPQSALPKMPVADRGGMACGA